MEFLLSFDINVKFHLKSKLQRACKMQMLCTSRLSNHAGFRPRFNKFKSLRVLSINYTRVGTCTHRWPCCIGYRLPTRYRSRYHRPMKMEDIHIVSFIVWSKYSTVLDKIINFVRFWLFHFPRFLKVIVIKISICRERNNIVWKFIEMNPVLRTRSSFIICITSVYTKCFILVALYRCFVRPVW